MKWGARLVATTVAWAIAVDAEGPARAETPVEPIRLEYQADAGCPNEAAFRGSVRARTGNVRFAGSSDAPRTFSVEVRAGRPASGRVAVTDKAGATLTRSVQGGTCDEVADALGLMVALAVDPRASIFATPVSAASAPSSSAGASGLDDELATGDSAVSPSTPAVAPPTPPPDAGSTGAAMPTTAQPGDGPPWTPASAMRSESSPSRAPENLFAGADLVVVTGVAPNPLVAASVVAGWTIAITHLWGLSVRAAFLRAESGKLEVPGGAADFTWSVGRVDACAMLWPKNRVRLSACGRFETGVLEVAGSDVAGGQERQAAWFAAGPVARVESQLLDPISVEGAFGPAFRARPERVYFLPNITAYAEPRVGFDAEVGLAVHFL